MKKTDPKLLRNPYTKPIAAAVIAGGVYIGANQTLITGNPTYLQGPVFRAESISVRKYDSQRESDYTRFRQLADRWEEATGHFSIVQQAIVHPLYLELIGMGDKIIPFLIEETRNGSPDWLPALRAIAGETARPDEGPTFESAVEAWTKWSQAANYHARLDFAI